MNSLRELPLLYSLPSTACCWGGGGGGGGNWGSQMQQAGLQAASTEREMLGQALQQLGPYTDMGKYMAGQYQQAFTPTAAGGLNLNTMLQNWPGLQFLQQQGIGGPGYTGAFGRYGASTGQALSGNALKGATNYGEQLASTYALQPYLSGLQFGTSTGAQAAGTGAGLTMHAADAIGGDLMAAAQGNIMGNIMAENARAAQGNWLSDVGGMLGMGAGMFLGMPGVGSSIGGMIGDAIKGWGYQGTAAEGGYIDEPTLVGERGPEIFVPDRPGYVIPNHLLPYSAFSGYSRSLPRWS